MGRKKYTFEEALLELDNIVNKMDTDENMSLDDAMKLFEKGMQLSKFCSDELKKDKLKVNLLIEQNGFTEMKPFDIDN